MEGQSIPTVADRRNVLAAARSALSGLREVLHQVPGSELPGWLSEMDDLAELAGAARVAVTAEAVHRGEVTTSQAASTTGWVRAHAQGLRAGGAGPVATLAEATGKPELAPVTDAVLAGRVSPTVAVTVLTEYQRLRPDLRPGADEAVLTGLVSLAIEGGSSLVRRLRPVMLARYGLFDRLQAEQDRAASQLSLSQPAGLGAGLVRYELVCDVEAKTVLEAAIGPLSAPVIGPDGERDTRSAGQRRGHALLQVVRRAVAAGGPTPSGVKASVLVTMPLTDLRQSTGAGTTLGVLGAGDLLAPETVRRMACDAGIIPVVLGGEGEILDIGRQVRLVTPAMSRALLLRDRTCTFPGCQAPGTWCDAHHLRHWTDGGETALGNLALQCGRHHTVVHRDRLHGQATSAGRVSWDQVPGSYNRWLAQPHDDPPDDGAARRAS